MSANPPSVSTASSTAVSDEVLPSGSGSGLLAPGRDLPPCQRDQLIDPSTCELMPGHQHPADDIGDLAESINIVGQLHSGQVFEFPDGRRWIAAGRRRWLACKRAGFLYRADLWQCSSEAIARGEQLAQIIRLAENEHRREPGVYDLAVQLRNIRNEHGFDSHEQLARHVKMSETRVKTYLSIFRASDRLLDAIQKENLPLAAAAELVYCEKQLGPTKTRHLLAKVTAGELSAADLERRRQVAKHGKRGARAKNAEADWNAACRRLQLLLAKDPELAESRLAGLLELLEVPSHGRLAKSSATA